jgi:ATP-binding cassette subfamily B protein
MDKFPHYMQSDATDCGPSCLRIVAKFFGRQYNLRTLRALTFKSKKGVSLLSLSDAAEKIGFRSQGVRINTEKLKEVALPCILYFDQNHFVVLYKIRKRQFYISDPAIGLVKYNEKEFLKHWVIDKEEDENIGIALCLEPTPDFYIEKGEKSDKAGFGYLLKYIKPYQRLIFQLILGFLTGSILSLILPFLTQAIVDVGITTNNLNFIVLVLIAQLVITLSQTAVGFVRSWIMLHVSVRVGVSLISDFLIKLMKLPIRFFDTKMIGDLRQRIDDNNRVQTFLTGSLISMSFGLFMFIIYSFVMAYYDMRILVIFYCGSILYVLWIFLFLKKRKEIDYKRFAVSASNQSNIYQLITGMQEIKLNNCEKQKRWEWERIQTDLFKVSIKGLTLQQYQQAGSIFINQAKNILISFITAKAVIEGDLTLGMMMAIQYIIGQLNAPISEFIEFIRAAQDAKISLERLGEIHNQKEEESSSESKIYELPSNKELKVEYLSFHYEGPGSPKVLDGINFVIPENKVTAIVGSSGSGKNYSIKNYC